VKMIPSSSPASFPQTATVVEELLLSPRLVLISRPDRAVAKLAFPPQAEIPVLSDTKTPRDIAYPLFGYRAIPLSPTLWQASMKSPYSLLLPLLPDIKPGRHPTCMGPCLPPLRPPPLHKVRSIALIRHPHGPRL